MKANCDHGPKCPYGWIGKERGETRPYQSNRSASLRRRLRDLRGLMSVAGLLLLLVVAFPQAGAAPVITNAVVVEMEGRVEVARGVGALWQRAQTNHVLLPGDQLRTGEKSRAVVRFTALDTVRLGEFSTIQIPRANQNESGFSLMRGILYFLHRDKPASQPVRTPAGLAVIRGTEFVLAVEENGRTTVSVLDGEVELSNASGQLALITGDEGVMEQGQAPRKTAVVNAVNVIQWALYYPAVLDVDELPLAVAERQVLADSLTAYRAGDLLRALEVYPAGRLPASDAERVYRAALLLAVGQVEGGEAQLNALGGGKTNDLNGRLAGTVRRLIAVVMGIESATTSALTPSLSPRRGRQSERVDAFAPDSHVESGTASEWMVESYAQQARANLDAAFAAARQATEQSPRSGFAWARVAELEFGFGRVTEAKEALTKSLELAPRNAQAVTLGGFLLAARGQIRDAIWEFERAKQLDGALGNAWLGRGLCRIRMGEGEAGREDLQIAATLEPQRALLRSYLGKAFSHSGDNRRANHELDLARKLDASDPTGWLYSALVKQQENEINTAVRNLEQSRALNDNRAVYRSRQLLDQDQAVRGANLAGLYQDAGMIDVSVREAARAVNLDYGNYSAHLFLANIYDALRDPRQINLRYETPWLSEYLVANLLAPVGAGTLSPQVTQQEYARLFERDRLGFVSSTEYLSNGDWLQTAAQYGTLGNSSYSAEAAYRSQNGHRPNNDLEQFTGTLRFKQQLTSADSVYLQGIYYAAESGDVNQYYDEAEANRGLRTKEGQEPIVLAGWHHEWSPESRSLLLVGRLSDSFEVANPSQQTLLLDRTIPANDPGAVIPVSITQRYRSELEVYTAEAQHIWQQPGRTLVVGARAQAGEFETHSQQSDPVFPFSFGSDQSTAADFARYAAYGYVQQRIIEPLWLIGGVTYDWMRYPENHRYAPVSSGEKTIDQVSPKAGLIWTPDARTTVRGGYAQSLGGVSLDQSFQLEPSQVAGFNQLFRSIIPEAVAGSAAAARFESAGISIEHQFPTATYLGLSGEVLWSEVERELGVYEFLPGFATSSTPERLNYRERSALLTLNQLIGHDWSLGARYRVSQAELNQQFTAIPNNVTFTDGFRAEQNLEAVLHQVQLFAVFNHASGFFSQADAWWFAQSNHGYTPSQAGDDFWQFNMWAGYRFARRRAEVRVGLLNITDQEYQLNPLNLHAALPHDRTLAVNVRFSF